MPGFNIGGSSGEGSNAPSATKQSIRSHTFKIKTLGPLQERDLPNIYVKSLKLPEITFDEELVNGGSLIYKFPKIAKFDDIEIVFYDVQDLYSELRDKWGKKIWNEQAGLRPADSYLNRCFFHIGYKDEGYSVECFNCWPKRISHGDLAYDRSDIKIITMVISCSHIKVIPDTPPTTARGGSPSTSASSKAPRDPATPAGRRAFQDSIRSARPFGRRPDSTTEPVKSTPKDLSFEAFANGSALADMGGATGIAAGMGGGNTASF